MKLEIIPIDGPDARGDETLYQYICHDFEDADIFIDVYVSADRTRIHVSDLDKNYVEKSPDISTPPGVGSSSTSEEVQRVFGAEMADLVRKWIQAVKDGDMIETDEIEGYTFRTWK